uniref:Uncharacterized protein n=1 Tax=Chondria sp. (in: red algae) TaxID=1982705 RepID=A0A1Z1MRR1_9FLOR|nr:hypothetical protein [Chondria sp. (in: red algae)]
MYLNNEIELKYFTYVSCQNFFNTLIILSNFYTISKFKYTYDETDTIPVNN